MKIINTKDNPFEIQSLKDYYNDKHKYIKFKCIRCGKIEIKRDVSIEKLSELVCGPCLRKEGTFKAHGSYTWNNPNKRKATCVEKYGVDNPAKLDKNKQILRDRANTDFYEKRQEKIRQTCLNKYGVDNVAKSEISKQHARETCMKKYGVSHPMKTPEGFKKVAWKNIFYDNEYFDSSWELAYWIWCKNHKLSIARNHQGFLLSNGSYFYPDFIVDGNLVEIKGDHLKKIESFKYKLDFCKKNNIKILSYNDLLPIFKEVYQFMKDNDLPLPRIKTKRAINEITDISQLDQYKNKNCKIQYNCSCCGSLVITGYQIIKHFGNLKCKKCRKQSN